MSAALQKAIENLEIRDVYLRQSHADCFDGFDPKYCEGFDLLEVEMMHSVRRSELVEVDEHHEKLFRVYILFGTRWVLPDEQEGEGAPRATIEAEFIVEYVVKNNIGKEGLDEFALKNASYHAWPYWREQLTSQCARMNLPKVVLPTMQIAQNSRKTDPRTAPDTAPRR